MTASCLSVDYGQPYLSVRAQFWIWNISGIIGYEGVHFILPFFLDVPIEIERRSSSVKFYVQEPVLEPRTHHILTPAKTVNTSCFIYTKRRQQQSDARQTPGWQGTSWAIQEFRNARVDPDDWDVPDARNVPDAQVVPDVEDVPGTSRNWPEATAGFDGVVARNRMLSRDRSVSSIIFMEMPQVI